MRNYHPASWSKQARELADKQYGQYLYYNYEYVPKYKEDEEWAKEVATEECYINFFRNSYRPTIIRYRAAKRFGRKMRGVR